MVVELAGWLILRIVPRVSHMPNPDAANQLQPQLVILIFNKKLGLKSGISTHVAFLESGLRLSCGLRWGISINVITVADTKLKFTNLFHCSPRTHTCMTVSSH